MTTDTTTRRATLAWARERDAELQARGAALLRIGNSLTVSHAAGQPVNREDVLIALVRATALAADVMALSQQVIAACATAGPAQGEV